MLVEQEILNNSLKDLLFREELLAKKYSELKNDITEPQLQQMIQTMEQSSRNRYKLITEKMNTLGIS
ncbi:hypothetical protein [Vallitalea maricola]|uniref:Uncharacterized protein n=1 Tax=Vallitalea maricola TaxID=3074433 RepID=A0ACB5UQU2_9FIRM|nr:hypothetical protein AN2V17_40910 [Vallitalea sp. AN17-2]